MGAAIADDPRGPFVDASRKPLICQADEGGSIDASPYLHTDGTAYLYWKNDGNHIGRPTHLYGQRLTTDGLTLTGERVRLLTNDKPWQAHVIEAPQMVQHDGRLALSVLLGERLRHRRLRGRIRHRPDGSTWLLYHAWPSEAIGSVTPGRQLWLDRVDWAEGKPVVHGPTATPQSLAG
ncbi:family 43 glycosylhydrolase [Actinoplanes sp. CA-252034]|uniref:family 43 glycosylhydrolase n=1 Tax=Actinoplanes sp. CA-252034 TaxID=3239906 RepID=UPI003D97F90E